ncbi:hypothetical protein J5N97_006903 [Dioscorea zingiberensis]|uniref:Dof-type domain-containing protein n=1 Tax=Dioscorea zingiberensis TaxID=325984 RepID=A0A9D5HUG1_9LILI|nr:hypothetical protein J5N97_006903 [Dioscorea zingiberensis]
MPIENKDPSIKLFGRTIPVSSCGFADKDLSIKEQNYASPNSDSKIKKPKTCTDDQAKEMKKPDKTLACPRCTSSDTKFCYFNNYNTSQPRHFCRQCQRYWTAGGTIRNVPIGAGRRQNKISASRSKHWQELKSNGTVLSFSATDTLTDPWSSIAYSSTLGKHTRDEEEKCSWISKTLRIDDSVHGGGLFNGIHSKNHTIDDASQVFHANPAPLFLSLEFHERS